MNGDKQTNPSANLGKWFSIALLTKVLMAMLSVSMGDTVYGEWGFGFFLPLVVMVAYLAYGWRCVHVQGTPYHLKTRYGDSAYFLGFLFTIASLIAALLDIGLKNNLAVDAVAIRFGAAMITTLLGMAIRVWLVTFTDRPNETIDEDETIVSPMGERNRRDVPATGSGDYRRPAPLETPPDINPGHDTIDGTGTDDNPTPVTSGPDKDNVSGKQEPSQSGPGIMERFSSRKDAYIPDENLEEEINKRLELYNKLVSRLERRIKNLDPIAEEEYLLKLQHLRDNLMLLTSRVQSDLEEQSKAVAEFCTNIRASTEKTISEMEARYQESLKLSAEAAAKAVEDIAKKNEETATKTLENVESFASGLTKKSLNDLDKTTKSVLNNVDVLVRSEIDKLSELSGVQANALKESAAKLREASAKTAEEFAKNASNTEAWNGPINDMAQKFGEVIKSMEDSAEHLATAADRVSQLAGTSGGRIERRRLGFFGKAWSRFKGLFK